SAGVARSAGLDALETEAFPHDVPNLVGDRARVGIAVQHDPAAFSGELPVGVADGGVELGACALQPVAGRRAAGLCDLVVDVGHDDEIRVEAAGRPAVDAV